MHRIPTWLIVGVAMCGSVLAQYTPPNSKPTLTDVTGLFAVCSGTQYLGYDGNCHTAGTVSSVQFNGGIVTTTNASTTPVMSITGIGGGVPYFRGLNSWNSTGILAAGQFVMGGGVTTEGQPLTTSFSVVPKANGGTGTTTGVTYSGTTGSIGGGLLAAGACATGTVTVTGATTAMVATASPAGGVDPTNGGVLGVAIDARVSAADTVVVSVCAPIAGTPTAAAYNVRVIQ